jgi:hypothetical protein
MNADSTADGADSGTSLRVATLNMALGQDKFLCGGAQFMVERIYALKAFVQDYDVICFQGVPYPKDGGRKRMLLGLATDEGFTHHYLPSSWPEDRKDDGGMMLVSRFPIVEQDYRTFTAYFDQSNLGSMYVRIEVKPGCSANVFNNSCSPSQIKCKQKDFMDQH